MIATATILGTLPTWILVAVALAVAYRVTKGGGGSAVSELSKANEVLTKAVHEEREKREQLGAEVRDLIAENAALGERTDFAKALAGQAATSEGHILTTIAAHETRAIERHSQLVVILELVAKKLGKEEEGE